MNRRLTACATALAVAGLSLVGVAAANADTVPSFAPYDEENPNPLPAIDGLVFFKNADLGWVVSTPIADVADIDYTVESSRHSDITQTAYAPSFQLVMNRVAPGTTSKYARLVWEPYMQNSGLDPEKGEYTNLQDGLWWTSKIANPAPGSQSSPQPLSFFGDGAGAGWSNVVVGAIDVHQGSTSDVASLVTKVSFNGHDVALGTPDATPFDQADIDGATAPLTDANAALTAKVEALTAQVATLNAYKSTHSHTDAAFAATADQVLAFKASLMPWISGTTKVGSLVSVSGTKYAAVTYHYQWFVGSKKVAGATKSTYLLPKSAVGQSVSVVSTRSYTDSKGVVHSVERTVKAVASVKVAG